MIEVNQPLTVRGLLLLQRFGNTQPTFSQIEIAQKIVDLISRENSKESAELSDLCFNNITSRETLIKDSKFINFQAQAFQEYRACGNTERL